MISAGLTLQSTAQNLVTNPSFEEGACAVSYNSTPAKIPPTITGWYSGSGASPDPFDICGTYTAAYDIVVPDILFGYQMARTGNKFMGFGFYSGWYEYIGTSLTQPLQAGETYQVSFSLSCGDLMSWAASDIGIYFSNTKIGFPENSAYGAMLNVVPQVTTPTGVHITDTTWQNFTTEFVAAGGEQYIVIGYFKPINAANTDFIQFPVTVAGQNPKANPNYIPNPAFPGGTGGTRRVYYYIDDVSVELLSPTPITLREFKGKVQQRKALLNWTTETESNNCRFEIERSTNGTTYSKIATVNGAVNSNQVLHYNFTDDQPAAGINFYRLKQVDCDGKHSYSKIVKLHFTNAGFSISPNPVHNELFIDRNNSEKVNYAIFDQTGRIVLKDNISGTRAKLSLQLPAGVYVLQLEEKTGTVAQKFIKL